MFNRNSSQLILALLALLSTSLQAASFTGLGFLAEDPNGSGRYISQAFGVSADGSVVVGNGVDRVVNKAGGGGIEAFRWTESGGMVGLGDLGSPFQSTAWGASVDGSVIVGNSGGQAFRWTENGGMVGLSNSSVGRDISSDGSVIVATEPLVTALIPTAILKRGSPPSQNPLRSKRNCSIHGLRRVYCFFSFCQYI